MILNREGKTMAMIRYSPFTGVEPIPGLTAFQETMNRLLAEWIGRPCFPPVYVIENENELVVKADVPDIKFEDIDVKIENGTLTLGGERKVEKTSDNGGWHRMERSYGT